MLNTSFSRATLVGLIVVCPLSAPFFAVSAAAAEGLRVSTDFPGGSGEVIALDAAKQELHLCPSLHEGQGWPCWWYVRLDGLRTGELVTVTLSAQPKPYRGKMPEGTQAEGKGADRGVVLAASWSQPDRAMLSVDQSAWTATPPCRRLDGRFAVYTFAAPAATAWLAWGPPFVPADAEALLAKVAAQTADAERFTLATTRGGRPVPGIRVGTGARVVWVQARQHAWEAGSSWVGRGFLEWVASDDASATALRKAVTVTFIPIMDVDRVALGAGGKEAVPRDHNRDWSAAPIYPEVAAAQAQLADYSAVGRLAFFLDLHNPGPSDRQPFFFGPFGLDEMPTADRDAYLRWHEIAAVHINGPLPLASKYRFATYVTTQEERDRMSSGWARNHAPPGALAMTLETAWNNPHSTAAGYQTVGRQLAQALARFLTER